VPATAEDKRGVQKAYRDHSLHAAFGVTLTAVLSDHHHGWKKILTPSLLLIGVASRLCAFARSFGLLLALHPIQGTGVTDLVLSLGR
jgi:MFS family permease